MKKGSSPTRLIPLFDKHEEVTQQDAASYEDDRPFMTEYLASFDGRFSARGDYVAVRKFLKAYEDTPTTFNNYRTQVERLLLWAWNKAGKSVLTFKRSDVEDFLKFSRNPDSDWISPAINKRFIAVDGLYEPNPAWRPFAMRLKKAVAKNALEQNVEPPAPVFKLNESSLKVCYAIINSFFTYCAADELIGSNPCVLIKRDKRLTKSKQLDVPIQKSLNKLQWEFLLETAELMAEEDPAQGERTLFCIVMMFSCYLRVGDLAGNGEWVPEMGSFIYEREAWWYHVVGKGSVQARIVVKPACVEYLTRYRLHRGLSPLPTFGETEPLLKTKTGRAGLQARQIRKDVQAVMDRTVERMKAEGFAEIELGALRSASLHWLRHTGATFDAPHRNPRHLQADLRHKSLATTQTVYYHSLEDERINEVQKLGVRR